ncbi:carboxypeptidase-like regulatory domain-containing protein [Pedobacter sp. UC225_65]|uniref:carboxypeptidase-like regulatory domain-containing protein n=1 Tax=Pedobacter sp. UC225_65 TaxID=3350173 RepID=UPI003671D13C
MKRMIPNKAKHYCNVGKVLLLATALQLTANSKLMAFNKNVSFSKTANSLQKAIIKGKVTDQQGLPIPGVSVVVKGTKNGVITDANGNYTINVEKADVLVFSFTGYTTKEIIVNTQTTIDIVLADNATNLGEVVIVGYSSKKQSEISSSISVVSGDKLRDVTSNEVSSLLQGRAPGVVVSTASGSPTSGSNIVIRGAGSINASTDP